MPWYVALFRALQKRAVQLSLAAIGSITITGILGFATGVIHWSSTGDTNSPGNTNSPRNTSDPGYSKYYGDSNDYLKTKDTGFFSHISGAKEEVWFVGLVFHISLADGEVRKVILKKLAEGVSVKFLIYDPTSRNIELVAQQYGRDNAKYLLSDCETTIKYLSEIYGTSKSGNLKKLEIKLYRDIPQSRLYIFDRNDPNNYTYFIPHVGQTRSGESPGYLFRNDSIAKEYHEAILRLWDSKEDAGVITFEAWLDKAETKKWLAGRGIEAQIGK
jgi:hypothetical protein